MVRRARPEIIRPDVERVEDKGVHGLWHELSLVTARGHVETRLVEVESGHSAVLCIGGVGGGFDSPAQDLYGWFGERLPRDELSVLRLRFRNPVDFTESIHDVLAGIVLIARRGFDRVALVGHSFGGAVAIQAASASPRVAAVVTLATQSHGTEPVRDLGRPLLAIHGLEDEVLPAACSVEVHARASEPKELRLVHAGHALDEVADELRALLPAWLVANLTPPREE